MALNIIENSDVMQFIETVEDERMKALLDKMHTEYRKYCEIGTVEDCKTYKEWCELSPKECWEATKKLMQAMNGDFECEKRYLEKQIKELRRRKDKEE